MDMISSTTSNTTAPSTMLNKQEAAMVASPPREEAAAAARNVKAKQQARQQQQVVASGGSGERKPRPQQDHALNCPRCNSTNTKFCYYNNYSMTQPRYFCKVCRRNWTQGGTLRNVPIGGGSRKNKQSRAGGSSSSSAPPASSSISNDSKKMNIATQQLLTMTTATTPMLANFPNVLPPFMSLGGSFQLPSSDHHSLPFAPLSLSPNPGTMSSFMDILRGGFLDGSSSNGMASLPILPVPPFGAMQHGHGMMGGSSDQQMIGPMQGVEQEVKPPILQEAAGGKGLQQWPLSTTHEQRAVGGDGSEDNKNNHNNMKGGASGSGGGVQRFWQGGFIN